MSEKGITTERSILVYKSYGGLGDIFFTLPALHLLKQQFGKITFATQPRLVHFFRKYITDFEVADETDVNQDDFDEVIELGNYPWFHNDSEKHPQIPYLTHRKVKQHSIEHYKDGVINRFEGLQRTKEPYPYFARKTSDTLYYTVHAGAGFLLKAWPIEYYARLIELIHDYYPQLTAKIIIGKDDPNPEPFFTNKNLKYELIIGGIEDVADEVSGAFFHVGNDAGITHLAGAFNTPILTIYGPTGPGSWGAFSEKVELIWGKRGNCSLRCNYHVILNCENRVCLNKTMPDKLLFHLMKLLSGLDLKDSGRHLINPEFVISKDSNSFIFKGKENEYLLEISDAESQEFIANCLSKSAFDIQETPVPKQFDETFEALRQLNIFTSIPETNLMVV